MMNTIEHQTSSTATATYIT